MYNIFSEMCNLQLLKLDFSCNKIETIPFEFRKMDTIKELIFDHNPLKSPPAYVSETYQYHLMSQIT